MAVSAEDGQPCEAVGTVMSPFANIDQPAIGDAPANPRSEMFTSVFSLVTSTLFTTTERLRMVVEEPTDRSVEVGAVSLAVCSSLTVPATSMSSPQIRLANINLRVLTPLSVRPHTEGLVHQ